MIVCLKDVVIHITETFLQAFTIFREVTSQFTFHVILLYCFVSMS